MDHLDTDLEPTHTATMWTSYLSGLMPDEHGITSWKPVVGSPPDLDFLWDYGEWTVFAAPVSMPPISVNCEVSDYHLKAEEGAWTTELKEFKRAYEDHRTDHFVGVIRCLDVASHSRKKDDVLKWYEKVFDIVGGVKFDLLLSDHGFRKFNRRGGEEDHSKDALIRGLDVERASEVVEYVRGLIESEELE